MAIKYHKISVQVSKRVQEQEFEPFEIVLEESVIHDCKLKNPKKARRKMYKAMKVELDSLIEKRLNEWED